jgi:hypothetical protein
MHCSWRTGNAVANKEVRLILSFVSLFISAAKAKRSHAKPRSNVDLKEIGCKCVGRIHLPQDRTLWGVLMNMIMTMTVNM